MHNVGDVLYVISNRKRQIFPVLVVEQVIRKTLSGEEVTYKVQIPGLEGVNPVDLHTLDGTVHETLQQAKSFLYEQATAAIESMLKVAHDLSRTFNSSALTPIPEARVDQSPPKMKVTLDDGTSAMVTLPDVQ